MRHLAPLVAVLLAGLAVATPSAPARTAPGFQSPTRNIGCVIDSASARCDIARHDWPSPRKPASCELDYGDGLAISRSGRRGAFVCAGDTVLNAGGVLAYGRSITRGGITCTSRASGVTCRNARGHGFRVSRSSYRRF